MRRTLSVFAAALFMVLSARPVEAGALPLLVLEQHDPDHDGKRTAEILTGLFERAGGFAVRKMVVPSADEPADVRKAWRPSFTNHLVVVLSSSPAAWLEPVRREFEAYVRAGGGLVCLHAAANPVADWAEYNRIIGLRGKDDDERKAPYVYIVDGKVVFNRGLGGAGRHRAQREFLVESGGIVHPIVAGMPARWKHTRDKLYDTLDMPTEQTTVLAWSVHEKSGLKEPMFTVCEYGRGRVFRTPMGHAEQALRCAGLQDILVRAADWVAQGKVDREPARDWPTQDASRLAPL
jgi:type 1 glutamine amidotransferase